MGIGSWKTADAGASPVIGVILMVGTTVILGATVYAWTSTYANVPQQSVKLLGLMPLERDDARFARVSIVAAMPGLRYADLVVSLDGVRIDLAPPGDCDPPMGFTFAACRNLTQLSPGQRIEPGDVLIVRSSVGQTLRLVDPASGTLVASVDV